MPEANLLTRLQILEERVTALAAVPARLDALVVQIQLLRQEMRDEFSALRLDVRSWDQEIAGNLREETQRLRTHMLVLHEDLVEKVRRLGEAWPSASPRAEGRSPAARRKGPHRRD
jgi:phosphoglycerate-specific signal transduction histidine kinase